MSNKWDISLDYIVEILKKENIDYIRINSEDMIDIGGTAQFPNFSYVFNKLGSKSLNNSLSSILFRRPGKPFEFVSENKPSDSILHFITDQWSSFLNGLQSISDILWINNPQKNHFAEMKINQLNYAEKLGLKIPATCITSDKNSLLEFSKKHDVKLISKALYSPLVREGKDEFFIFSNKIQDVDTINEKDLSMSPTIFQEELENKTDYRVTVIGSDVLTAEISYEDKSVLDWRKIKDGVKIKDCVIPEDVSKRCVKLVSELGLVFGAIDLVKSNDQYYFLEINPNGEWGWLQRKTNLPIAQTIVKHLVRKQ